MIKTDKMKMIRTGKTIQHSPATHPFKVVLGLADYEKRILDANNAVASITLNISITQSATHYLHAQSVMFEYKIRKSQYILKANAGDFYIEVDLRDGTLRLAEDRYPDNHCNKLYIN